MQHRTARKSRRNRVADEIMGGMHELQRMLDDGKSPNQAFTVKTIDVPEPRPWRPKQIRALRDALGVSQALFAHLLGVSAVLVKSWERGARQPSPLARRLLDTINADPSQWLELVRHVTAGRAA